MQMGPGGGYSEPKPKKVRTVHHSTVGRGLKAKAPIPHTYTSHKPIVHHPKAPVYHPVKTTHTVIQSKHSAPKTVHAVKPPKKTASKSNGESYAKYINDLYNNSKKAQLAALASSQNKAKSQVNAQKKQTNQQYYQEKNQADVQNNQSLQRLRELMAANGLGRSGENISGQVALNAARQQTLGGLNQQQQAAIDAYNQQISQIMDPSQKQQIINNLNAQRAQALANNYWNNHLTAAQNAQYGWNYYQNAQNNAAQQALAQSQLAAYTGFNSGSGGGGKGYQSDLAQAQQMMHIPASQIPAFNWVIQHESSFNPNAQNPKSTAHGYGQFLNSTVANMNKETGLNYNASPVDQLAETYQYMVDRYGSPQGAMNFWQKNGYY